MKAAVVRKPRRQLLQAWVCESSLSHRFPKQPLIWERSNRKAPNSLQLCPSLSVGVPWAFMLGVIYGKTQDIEDDSSPC